MPTPSTNTIPANRINSGPKNARLCRIHSSFSGSPASLFTGESFSWLQSGVRQNQGQTGQHTGAAAGEECEGAKQVGQGAEPQVFPAGRAPSPGAWCPRRANA